MPSISPVQGGAFHLPYAWVLVPFFALTEFLAMVYFGLTYIPGGKRVMGWCGAKVVQPMAVLV